MNDEKKTNEDELELEQADTVPAPVVPSAVTPRRRGGFAALSPEERRAIGRRGAAALQASGRAHRWTPETASAAGRKGGIAKGRRGKPEGAV
jgi:general stress protein YciG